MVNAGSAEVGAIAYATGLTGATAHAYNTIPIRQTADGGDVDLTIDNNGPLLLDAVATASAVTAPMRARSSMARCRRSEPPARTMRR